LEVHCQSVGRQPDHCQEMGSGLDQFPPPASGFDFDNRGGWRPYPQVSDRVIVVVGWWLPMSIGFVAPK
jgi:hypothetical protein